MILVIIKQSEQIELLLIHHYDNSIGINLYKQLLSMTSSVKDQILELCSKKSDFKDNILFNLKGNRLWITYNRPKRYNAFSMDMYVKLANKLNEANADDNIKFIIITGASANFSSGNDLGNFLEFNDINGSKEDVLKFTTEILSDLCVAIINSKKPIFAITEGKVIGFAFTQLALYDRVFSVNSSQFYAPLVKLAQGPEMCSAYTFPKIFGKRLGEQLIVSGTKVDSAFLAKYDLVSECKSRAEAEQRLDEHLSELDSLDWSSYLAARKLMRDQERELLLKVNKQEIDNLYERWGRPELVDFVMNYLSSLKAKPKL